MKYDPSKDIFMRLCDRRCGGRAGGMDRGEEILKKKKVWRYYCGYCKKSGCSGGHIKKHEERCTMNPNRFCGICKLNEEIDGPPNRKVKINEMIKILPDINNFKIRDEEWGPEYDNKKFNEAMEPALKKLRELTNNCPACILAALRQKGIIVPMVIGFDYKNEMQNILNDYNDWTNRNDGLYYP